MNCLSISELPLELRSITEALLPFTQTTIDPQGLPLTAVVDPRTEGLQITLKADGVHITAQSRIQFSRALGLAAEALKADRLGTISQVPCYRHLETMVDCARNAVPTVESLKRFAAHTALMGYTGLQLYVEDVFELPGYPYFGYMRGAYSKEELQELDDYCHMLGMELVPCIQTLAHLGRALKWQCFEEITDFDDILLADDPRTYAFIEAMVSTIASMNA